MVYVSIKMNLIFIINSRNYEHSVVQCIDEKENTEPLTVRKRLRMCYYSVTKFTTDYDSFSNNVVITNTCHSNFRMYVEA